MISKPFDVTMPIVTDRLVIRPINIGDGCMVYEAVRESWPELSKWDIWTLGAFDKVNSNDYDFFCQKKSELFQSREDLTFLVFNKNSLELIGGAGLHKPDWENRIFNLGFWIRSSKAGKGYATETSKALTDYAFDKLSASKVLSHHAEGNTDSHHVLKKTGFKSDGMDEYVRYSLQR